MPHRGYPRVAWRGRAGVHTPCQWGITMLLGTSRNRWTFPKIKNLRFLQNYDGYNCIFGIKLKGLSLSFFLVVMQWNQNVLNIKYSTKTWFLTKTASLKLEKIHNYNTYFHLTTSIVLKLFDDKCTAKACKISSISLIDVQEVVFFHAVIVTFFEAQNVTLLNITLLTVIFHSPFKMKSQNIKVCLLKCLSLC